MRKTFSSRIVSVVSAAFIATSGFISLLIDNVFKPFLGNAPEVKLVIILASVFSAYHVFLSFTLTRSIKEEHIITNDKLEQLTEKNNYVKSLVPFSSLDEIERRHGRDNQNIIGTCEIWIIANLLQESSPKDKTEADDLINTIYDNITKYKVHYYYILPDTDKSKRAIESLTSRLRQIHQRKKRRSITGGISYKFDNQYADAIISDYFDIVLYIDCDSNGKPCLHGEFTQCEGYQCFSNFSKSNEYFYQKIENVDKLFCVRDSHSLDSFSQIDITI